MKYLLPIIALLCIVNICWAQDVTSIAEVRQGTLDTEYKITGIALNGSELRGVRYIMDETGYIAVYNGDFNNEGIVEQGDEIIITGNLIDFNGLLEISSAGSDAYSVESSGNALPSPIVSTLSDFNDDNESKLMVVENVTFDVGGNFESATNYDITDANGNKAAVRIDQGTNLVGTPIPTDKVSVTGLLGEFNGTFQLFPRYIGDIASADGAPGFASGVVLEDFTQNSIRLSFDSQNPGNTVYTYGLTTDYELGQVADENFVTNHDLTITGLEPGNIYYVKIESTSETGETTTADEFVYGTVSESTGAIDVFFNKPVNTEVSSGTDATYDSNFGQKIVSIIESAEETLDIAIYNFDNVNGIPSAINAAYNRGVAVRFVTDEDNDASDYATIQIGDNKIRRAGGFGIMHHKLIVVDAFSEDANKPMIVSGSTNFTDGQLHNDPNNLIVIQDQTLAKAYTLEIDMMFTNTFGQDKTDNNPEHFKIGGSDVELYIGPSDEGLARATQFVNEADHNLYFAILAFTNTTLAYAIENRINDNVFVAGIMNNAGFDPADDVTEPAEILSDDMGSNLIDANDFNFHHKYLIADQGQIDSDPSVLSGSTNWSGNGFFRSDENFLVIHDESVANQYYQEWSARFEENGGEIDTSTTTNPPSITSISEVRQYAADNELVDDDSFGVDYTVEGVAINGSELRGVRYIYDGTGYIAVFNGEFNDAGVVEKGDKIEITGELIEFNGLLEISSSEPTDFKVVSSGNDLPAPISTSISDFNEQNEAKYILVENVTFNVEGNFEASTNYDIVDESGNTAVIRIDPGTDLAGTPIPTENADIIGVLGEFNGTFQLFPRSTADITTFTSIDDIILSNLSIQVYPNPVQENLFVSMDSDGVHKIEVIIADAQGKTVQTEIFNSLSGQNVYGINISSLAKGMYVLNINGHSQKFILK